MGMNSSEEVQLSKDFHVNGLLRSIGLTFISVDQSPLEFPSLELIQLFENLDGFSNIMISHYKNTLKINVAKILGNLDIMGNPVSLFSNVKGGFKSIYE